ncbi:hypothetical protein FQN57_000881 [Myotisia sp. PD_48]|nr:hypothetical protein FQN57_000881 [Myotisia sp. PD_48]
MAPWDYAVYATQSLTTGLTVPKSRRPRFKLTLRIIDMINVPLGVGTAYVKWQLPSSTSPEHNGHTEKAPLQNHRAFWDYEKFLHVRLTVDRNQLLQDCDIQFDVFQEFTAGNRGDRVLLGNIKLNLAEYVDKSESEQGITRRYLMQNCKINATVNIGIAVQQIEGESNFIAYALHFLLLFGDKWCPLLLTFSRPPLKPATVFSGIAGVLPAEHGEVDDSGSMPSISNRSREYTDLQDYYHSTLAATWACGPDELTPHELIENIFAGGDGFPANYPRPKPEEESEDDEESLSDTDSRRTIRDIRDSPTFSPQLKDHDPGFHTRGGSRKSDFSFGAVSRDKSGSHSFGKPGEKKHKKRPLTDSELMEDLRSWEITVHDHPISQTPLNFQAEYDNTPPEQRTTNQRPKNDFYHVEHLKNAQVLGKPARVVIVNKKPRDIVGPYANDGSEEGNINWRKGPRELLAELRIEAGSHPVEVAKNFQRLRELHTLGERLDFVQWESLHASVHDGFTYNQLAQYYRTFNKDRKTCPEDQRSISARSGIWKAGTTPFMDPESSARENATNRIAGFKQQSAKKRLVQKILRECWQLSIKDEVGQLDMRLGSGAISVLLVPDLSPLRTFAESNNVNIDVSRSLNLVRITGSELSCGEVKDQLLAWVSDLQSLDISLEQSIYMDLDYIESTFSPWLNEIYNVGCEIHRDTSKLTIYYLPGQERDVQHARRTLYLALMPLEKEVRPVTHFPKSELAQLSLVLSPDSLRFEERPKNWVRWTKISSGAGRSDPRCSRRPPASIYSKGPTSPYAKLSNLLFTRPYIGEQNLNPESACEVVTATAGKCLFENKPAFKLARVAFDRLESSTARRAFITDAPNTLSFLNSLDKALPENNPHTFCIQLVPSPNQRYKPPTIELELEASSEDGDLKSLAPLAIKSASVVSSLGHVDMLMPESSLDMRFHRKIYHNIIIGTATGLEQPTSLNDGLLHSSLRECINKIQLRLPLFRQQSDMPLFFTIQIPAEYFEDKKFSDPNMVTKIPKKTPEYMSAEYYISPPVRSLVDANVTRYAYKNFELHFSSQNLGPYLPMKSTEIKLILGCSRDKLRLRNGLPWSPGIRPGSSIENNLYPFYIRACQLAFELGASQQPE